MFPAGQRGSGENVSNEYELRGRPERAQGVFERADDRARVRLCRALRARLGGDTLLRDAPLGARGIASSCARCSASPHQWRQWRCWSAGNAIACAHYSLATVSSPGCCCSIGALVHSCDCPGVRTIPASLDRAVLGCGWVLHIAHFCLRESACLVGPVVRRCTRCLMQ